MIRRLKQDPTDWYAKNKLEPSWSPPRIPRSQQAEEKAGGPLERSDAEVEAAVEEHGCATLWAPLANVAPRPVARLLAGDARPFRSRQRTLPRAARPRDRRTRHTQCRLGTSEILSGLLVAAFALFGMYRRWSHAQWITAARRLDHACPLVFWTTSAAAYPIDTLAGMLIVAFAVMIRRRPE